MKVKCNGCGIVVHRPKSGMKHTGCPKSGWWEPADPGDTAVGHKAAHVRKDKPPADAPVDVVIAERPVRQKAKKGQVPETVSAASKRSPAFQPNWDFFLWNRGKWRGWAVAGQGENPPQPTLVYDPDGNLIDPFLRLETDYGRTYDLLPSRLMEEVEQGHTFIVEPGGVLELLQRQLLRLARSEDFPADNLPLLENVLKCLVETATALQTFKEAQKGEVESIVR